MLSLHPLQSALAGILALATVLFASHAHGAPSSFNSPANNSGPLATTKNGTYEGIHDAQYNQDYFLGIPFAAPPIGERRFNFPAPINSSFTGVKSAQKFSSVCVGYGVNSLPTPELLHTRADRPLA